MDDPRIKIQAGIEGDFVLIGFPHHKGAKLEGQRLGQDHGPDCLRRFLEKIGPLVNMEYNKSIEKFVISDYGNIHVINDNDLSALIGKLQEKVNLIKSKNHFPIIIGGSRDCSYVGGQSKVQIKVCAVPDLGNPYDGDKLSVDCAASLAIQNFKTNIEFFGWSSQLTTQQLDMTNSLQSIRRYQKKLEQDILKPNTQAGQLFQQLLQTIQEDDIHLSFSLESIDGANCPGVSRPAVIGLTAEESVEIMLLAGQDMRIKSVDITDYNPTIEDYRSGFLLGNMIYYFIMGRGAPI